MRKLGLVVAGMIVGACIGVMGWQVGAAQEQSPPDSVVVCQRPNWFTWSPRVDGSCPAGYTRHEVTETPPDHDVVYRSGGLHFGPGEVFAVTLPAGRWQIFAHGDFIADTSVVSYESCGLRLLGGELDRVSIYNNSSEHPSRGFLTTVADLGAPERVSVDCSASESASNAWRIYASPIDELVNLNPEAPPTS